MRGGLIFNGLLLGVACGFCWTLPTSVAEEAGADAGPKPVIFKVTPAKPPYRPLKNNLLPKKLDLQSGDAAPLYLKACLLATDMTRDKEFEKRQEKIGKWLEMSPAELPREEVRAGAGYLSSDLGTGENCGVARALRLGFTLPRATVLFDSLA